MFSSSKINPESALAYYRDVYCSDPIMVCDFAIYPEIKTDAIHQTKLIGGIDHTRLVEAKRLISSFDVEKDVKQFTSLGGCFVISPTFEDVCEHKNFKVHLRPDDFVIPMCHEGMNRSQVMHLVAKSLKSQVGVDNVSLPHGAESGFDPYTAFSDLSDSNYFGYIHGRISTLADSDKTNDWLHKCFYQAFGVEKACRIGQTHCETSHLMLNPDEFDMSIPMFAKLATERTTQRKFMDNFMYDSDILNSYTRHTGRVVVIAFCRAASIFLHRLLENSKDKDLSNIVIISLPYPDTISRAGGRTDLIEYKEKTGLPITRDAFNALHQKDVFAFYASLFQMIVIG